MENFDQNLVIGIDVGGQTTKCGIVDNSECIQCGACVDNCPKNILSYGMIERKENRNGNREKN